MVNYRRGYQLTSTWSFSPLRETTILYTSFVLRECAPWIFLLPASSFLQRTKMLSVRQNTSDPVSTRNSIGPILLPSSPSTIPSMLRNSPTVFSSSMIQRRPTATMDSFFIFSPKAIHKPNCIKAIHNYFSIPAVSIVACTSLLTWVAMSRLFF